MSRHDDLPPDADTAPVPLVPPDGQEPSRAMAASGTAAWETPPPRTPVLRWRAAVTAVMIVLVAGGAWWAVAWLTSPAPPSVVAAASPTDGAGVPSVGRPGGVSHPGSGGPSSGARGGSTASGSAPGTTSASPDGEVRVHVVGEVARPGVVTLRGGARVADAIAAAGGATGAARPDRVNLAAPLTDGEQVLVPSASTPAESLAPRAAPPTGGKDGGAQAPGTGTARGKGPAGKGGGGKADGAVDLNTADAATLETLPGVGPATAQRIIDHRETVGPFTGLQDLDAVSGIGPATLERLRDHVSW